MSPIMQKAIDELYGLNEQQIMYIIDIISRIKNEAAREVESQDISEQMFYSDSNMRHLLKNIQAAEDGKLTEHDLIEGD